MAVKKAVGPSREVYDWSEVEREGRANPGQWLEVTDQRYRYSTIISLQQGKNRRFPKDEWTFGGVDTEIDLRDGRRYCTLRFRHDPK